jgi:hypothetical protein
MTGRYGDAPAADEERPDGGAADFADEHSDTTLADDEPDGPERSPDESVPRGLAGADPSDA